MNIIYMENKKHKQHDEEKTEEKHAHGGTECGCDKNNGPHPKKQPCDTEGEESSALKSSSGVKCGCEGPAPSFIKAITEEADKNAPDYYGQLLRLKADFENYRKRVEKEKPELVKFGKAEMLIRLLPLYDMLMQAHLHMIKAKDGNGEESAATRDIVKGLEMIFKEFSKVFESEGIRPMDVVGKPYYPMGSEIIGIDEGTDENDGLVTAEFQKGFYYGDKVLRTARVKIAKKKAPAGEEKKEEK